MQTGKTKGGQRIRILMKPIIFTFYVCCIAALRCASAEAYPKSDHNDGKGFYNPTENEDMGIWEYHQTTFHHSAEWLARTCRQCSPHKSGASSEARCSDH